MQKRIAILYDFDYTLTPAYMHEFGLMQDFGYNNVKEFFQANEKLSMDEDMDMCLSLMCGLLEHSKLQNKEITRDYLKKCGNNITYYPGVVEWFDKINNIGKSIGYEIEHYVVSSGIKEIVEGTSIANKFKRIYGSFYAYKNNLAFWPCQIVNYTSKTQYIYRVRKNALDDLRSIDKVNEKMNDNDLLPFQNIIYLGDSETDIPSFKVIKNGGGLSICVYGDNKKAQGVAEKCFKEGRVNFFTPADYREGGELYNLVVGYIKSIAK
jgi:2-hydroxy-3-keto-5-methylthiopentenyl-1-phosphate phosphatase